MVKRIKKVYAKVEWQECADKGKRLIKEALRLCIRIQKVEEVICPKQKQDIEEGQSPS